MYSYCFSIVYFSSLSYHFTNNEQKCSNPNQCNGHVYNCVSSQGKEKRGEFTNNIIKCESHHPQFSCWLICVSDFWKHMALGESGIVHSQGGFYSTVPSLWKSFYDNAAGQNWIQRIHNFWDYVGKPYFCAKMAKVFQATFLGTLCKKLLNSWRWPKSLDRI